MHQTEQLKTTTGGEIKNNFYSLLPGLTDMVDLSVFLLEADTHNV
jgi:hypothetical protein